MRKQVIFLAGALAMAPLGARGADLVVWWEKGYYAEEDEAVREIIAAFERETRKEVELVQYGYPEIYDKVEAVAKIGQPPDFLFSTFSAAMIPQWAYENPLADLQGVLGPLLDLFDADLVQASMLLNGTTHRRGLYALPMGQSSNHVHVWSNFLERAGFTLADIPDEWDGSGHSGAIGCSRGCAKPSAATTSGASGFLCRPHLSRPTTSSSNSS